MSRKSTLTRKVRRAYRQDALARICTMPERDFGRAFGMTTTEVESPYRSYQKASRWGMEEDLHYHFRDNGSRVLAVAHLDTVVAPGRRAPHFSNTGSGPLIVSGALDDRLGAYVILDLLPRLGVTCDWLLTTGEESCQSTAGQFEPAKDYDHMIEFDRGGTDVVMYQYEDRASRKLVEAAGATMGQGSFSDVAALEQLGVKGFNWGVGYQGDYHSERGYAYLNNTFAMVAKYLRFSAQNAGTALPHDRYRDEDDYYDSRYGGYDRYFACETCGARDTVDSVTWYCTACGACQDCGATHPDIAAEWAAGGREYDDMDVCQCYTPKRQRESLAEAMDAAERRREDASRTVAVPVSRDWTGMTWDEYLAQRPSGSPGWTQQTWTEYVASGYLGTANAEVARQALLDAAAEADAAVREDQEELDAALQAAIERDGDDPDSDPGRAAAYEDTQDHALAILDSRMNVSTG